MKLSVAIVLTFVLILFAFGGKAFSSQKVVLRAFYFDPGFQCPECGGSEITSEFARVDNLLAKLQSEYGTEKLSVEWLNVKDTESSQLFHQYNLTRFPAVVAVAQEGVYPMTGSLITEDNLKYVINEYLLGKVPGPISSSVPSYSFSDIALAFSLGFFSGWSPCLMAMLAFILTYTTGTSHGLKSGISKAVIFAAGLVTAVTLVGVLFLLLEVSVSNIFGFLAYFTWVASGIMILVGLNLVGVLKLPVSTKSFFQKLAWKFGFSAVGLFALGFLFYFVKVHCAIPFFMILLTQVPTQVTFLGVVPFIVFGIGVVTPFLGIGIVGGGAPKLAKQVRERYRDTIRAISGLILIGYGVWLIAWMLIWAV